MARMMILCVVSLLGLIQAVSPLGLFGSPLFRESVKNTRGAEQDIQNEIQRVVSQINAAAGSLNEKTDLSRRESQEFARSAFGHAFLPFHLMKKSLDESAKRTRDVQQQIQDNIKEIAHKINAATGSLNGETDLSRRDNNAFVKSVFGSAFLPFRLMKKSVDDSAIKTRAAEQQVQDSIQDIRQKISDAVGKMKEAVKKR